MLRRSSDAHNPSRAFRYLQDQYDQSSQLPVNRTRTVDNRNDLVELYQKCMSKNQKQNIEIFFCPFFNIHFVFQTLMMTQLMSKRLFLVNNFDNDFYWNYPRLYCVF